MKKDKKNKKHSVYLQFQKNSIIDKGDGLIKFKNGLVITDNTEQWSGTRYDIKSMNVDQYDGKLTADHSRSIKDVIGTVGPVRKVANKKVVTDWMQLAINENALALYAYNMILAGYLTDFSIETIGPWPDEEGIYHESNLVGLSLVVKGNNKSARVNEVALNSIEQAREKGLDISLVEQDILCNNGGNKIIKKEDEDMKFLTIKNSRNFKVRVSFKNASGEETTRILRPGASVDVSEDQKDLVENQIKDAKAPEAKQEASQDLATIVKNAVQPLADKVTELEKQLFDNGAKEPEFKKGDKKVNTNKITAELDGMDYREIHGMQINLAWEWLKQGSAQANRKLMALNQFNLEALQAKKIVRNTITISDMGNFVISPELLSDIEGHRSDFSAILGIVNFQETLSTQMAWLERSGDISMSEVEMCDDEADGNLKPISEYGATIRQSNLHELAAVTPVCNAATRFLAADLLGDVAAGYRNDYDRKKAQLLIARLQQAVDYVGSNKLPYNGTSDTTTLQSWIRVWSQVAEEVGDGVYVFNYKTYGELLSRMVAAGFNGPMAGIFTTGDQPMLLGRPYVIVPNELLPSLNSAETKSFTVEGVNVTINQAVFYFKPSIFSGRVSGGLQYDLSTEAAYEDNGTVKSAYQRNELVLRGSFFRGGAVRDREKVASMAAAGVS